MTNKMAQKIIVTYRRPIANVWGDREYIAFNRTSQEARVFHRCLVEDGCKIQLYAAEPIDYATFLSMNSDGTTN